MKVEAMCVGERHQDASRPLDFLGLNLNLDIDAAPWELGAIDLEH